jgi:hypothetical protein
VNDGRFVGRRGLGEHLRAIDGEPGRTRYADGAARIEHAGGALLVRPPYGLAHERSYDHVVAGPLLEELERDRLIAVLLVRLGGYGVAIFDGEHPLETKVGSRLVHGRHRAGGSSANRFRRRREEQAQALHDAAAATAARVLVPWLDRVEAVVLGGDREAVAKTIARRRALEPLAERAAPRFLAVPDPRQRVLEALGFDLYSAWLEREPSN